MLKFVIKTVSSVCQLVFSLRPKVPSKTELMVTKVWYQTKLNLTNLTSDQTTTTLVMFGRRHFIKYSN